MTDETKILQLFYAAALSDAAYHYGRHRVFDKVTQEKKEQQVFSAKRQLSQLGIEGLTDVYKRFSQIFGCALWSIEEKNGVITASSNSCLLCALARKQGSPQPCRPFCINPFTAYAAEFGYELDVQETLWDGERCLFVHR